MNTPYVEKFNHIAIEHHDDNFLSFYEYQMASIRSAFLFIDPIKEDVSYSRDAIVQYEKSIEPLKLLFRSYGDDLYVIASNPEITGMVHLDGIDLYITPEQCHSSNKEL